LEQDEELKNEDFEFDFIKEWWYERRYYHKR
jgi:hypothetical protein